MEFRAGKTSMHRLQIFQDANYIFLSFFLPPWNDFYGSLRCITRNDSFLCDANPRILREKVGRKEKRVTVSAVVAPCYTVDRKKKYESSLLKLSLSYLQISLLRAIFRHLWTLESDNSKWIHGSIKIFMQYLHDIFSIFDIS